MRRKTELNPLPDRNLEEKAKDLKKLFKGSQDLLSIPHKTRDESYEILYFNSLVDQNYLDQYILPKFIAFEGQVPDQALPLLFQAKNVSDNTVEEISRLLLAGNVLFLLEHSFFAIHAGSLPKRTPEESAIETSIRGPKDGFVEDIRTNISLIRRRLNTPSLCLEEYSIGKRSNTKVVLMYMEDLIDQRVLDEIHMRLEKTNLDILTSIYALESYVRDRPYSIFPSMDYSGRPDFIVQALNQGRFALIVDGNPTVSYAPVSMLVMVKSPEDSYISYAYVSMERMLRLAGLLISAFLPGLWVSFSSFNIEQIPYFLLATISISRFGIPLSTPIEMAIILLLFEMFNEAGVRLPRAIGQTVAVLGGLIVGDAAIRAGLTSPTMLVVAAITFVANFTLVSQYLSTAITILRFIILLFGTLFGLFGVLAGIILTILYLSTITSFGEPLLGSLAPFKLSEAFRSFMMAPRQWYNSRTDATSPEDTTRQEDRS
ncbi:spore germination protein [Neobacillus sp. M.A.Huq-85]|nr:spore germination protein [Neobacillus cucumis]